MLPDLRHLLWQLASQLEATVCNQPVAIYGDSEQSRDFTFVDNVFEAHLLALKETAAVGKMCNIGCGDRISLNHLLRLLEKQLGIKAQLSNGPAKPGDVRHSVADIELARSVLGFTPKVMVEGGTAQNNRGTAWQINSGQRSVVSPQLNGQPSGSLELRILLG